MFIHLIIINLVNKKMKKDPEEILIITNQILLLPIYHLKLIILIVFIENFLSIYFLVYLLEKNYKYHLYSML